MAKGYWIAHIEVTDTAAYQLYRENIAEVLAEFGGRFIVRAGAQTVAEGAAKPRTVVIEFPDFKAAQDCYFGPVYQTHMQKRLAASTGDIVIVEGWDAP